MWETVSYYLTRHWEKIRRTKFYSNWFFFYLALLVVDIVSVVIWKVLIEEMSRHEYCHFECFCRNWTTWVFSNSWSASSLSHPLSLTPSRLTSISVPESLPELLDDERDREILFFIVERYTTPSRNSMARAVKKPATKVSEPTTRKKPAARKKVLKLTEIDDQYDEETRVLKQGDIVGQKAVLTGILSRLVRLVTELWLKALMWNADLIPICSWSQLKL